MVAEMDYHDGDATTVRLYPLDVGNTRDRTRRGMPHFADPATANRILTNLKTWSAALGTEIEIDGAVGIIHIRSEEHTSELQSLMRISYAVFCLKKKTRLNSTHNC